MVFRTPYETPDCRDTRKPLLFFVQWSSEHRREEGPGVWQKDIIADYQTWLNDSHAPKTTPKVRPVARRADRYETSSWSRDR